MSVLAASATSAEPAFFRAIRSLDGEQFLEDEPIWICDESDPVAGMVHVYRLTGIEEGGRRVRFETAGPIDFRRARSTEFVTLFRLPAHPEIHDLLWSGGLRAGSYEIRRMDADTARVLARFRVVEPRGSEVAVRAGLARAARLAERADAESRGQATLLVESILRRYPNTSYRTIAYLHLWATRDSAATAHDAGAWIDEAFAHFHDSCFGVFALDRFVRGLGVPEVVLARLRRVSALYRDTRLARAAASYL